MRSFGRAISVAVVASFMLAAPAVAAKKKEEPPKLKLSKDVQPLLGKAQTAQQAGDHAGALVLLAQADALPNKSADDVYIISLLTLNSAIQTKDNALIEKSLEGGIASGRLTAEEESKFRRNLGAMALQRGDTTKAAAEFEKLLAMTPTDAGLMAEISELQRRQGQPAKGLATLNSAIALQEKSGQKADESWYRRALAVAYDGKMPAETAASSEALVKAYPNPTNWRDALIIYRDSSKLDDQGNLDVMRLMRANSALAGERDYVEYADTASTRGLPGEAKSVLDEGIAKGALKATAPSVKELSAQVAPKIAADRGSLPALDKEAMASKTGKLAMATADAWLGYGEWAKAANLYKAALAKGGVDVATANIRLGYALARSGDKAGAAASFDAVPAGSRAQLARFYKLWLAQLA